MNDQPRFAPTARELYYTGSGQTPPSPTDEEIASAIRGELAHVLGADAFRDPVAREALAGAARAVRGLFPSNPTTKDSD